MEVILGLVIGLGSFFGICYLMVKKGEKDYQQAEKVLKEKCLIHEKEYQIYSTKFDNALEEYRNSDYFYHDDTTDTYYSIKNNKFCILHSKYTLEYLIKYLDEKIPNIVYDENYDLDNIKYYQIEGSIDKRQIISGGGGGGSSVKGAVVGGLIAGDAGAIIGSRNKINDIKTTYVTTDDRILVITFKDNTTLKLNHKFYEVFLDFIPEKDYENYIENKKAKGKVN